MAKVLTLEAGGLVTDPSSITAGNGTMSQADNVVIARPNVIQPRPGFHKEGDFWATGVTDYVPVTIIPRNGFDYFFVGRNSSGAFGLFAKSSKGAVLGEAEPPDYALANTSYSDARGNTYLTTKDGVRKISRAPTPLEVATTAGFGAAGIPPMPSGKVVQGTGYTEWMASNASVAYQWCLRRVDDNEVVIRSAPSPWVAYTEERDNDPTTGLAGSADLRIQLPLGVIDGDVIEIYRSRIMDPIGVTPSSPTADLFLVDEVPVTQSQIDAASTFLDGILYQDTTANQLMGRALYTSPSQGGALAANYPPPKCHQITSWADCTWYADTVSKRYVNIAVTNSGKTDRLNVVDGVPTPIIPDGMAERLAFMRVHLGVGTGGNTYFTTNIAVGLPGMMTDEYIQVVAGMGVSDAGSVFPEGTKIVSKEVDGTDYKFTIDKPLNGSGSLAFTTLFHDVVSISSGAHTTYEFWASEDETYPDTADDPYRRNFICTANEGDTAGSLARVINAGMEVHASSPTEVKLNYNARSYIDPFISELYGTVFIESSEFNAQSFTVSSTKPAAVEARLPSYTLESAYDTNKGRLYFSKIEQPEHVPVTNWISVGEEGCRILAVTPLATQLIIWTEAGVYRLTGSAPNLWRVSLVDSSVRLISPEAQCALAGAAFAWTNIGIVQCNGHSVRTISGGIVQDDIRAVTRKFGYGSTGNKGIFMAPHFADGLLVIGVPSGTSQIKSDHLLVKCLATDTWTKWSMEARTMVYSETDEILIASLSDYFELRYETTEGFDRTHDGYHAVTPDGVIDGTVYLDSTSTWTPEIGDRVIITDGDLGAVFGTVETAGTSELPVVDTDGETVVDSLTGETVYALTGYYFTLDPAYAGTDPLLVVAYETIVVEMQWNVHTLGDPGIATRWMEMQIELFDTGAPTIGEPSLTVGAANEASSVPATNSLAMPTAAVASRPFRIQLPRQVHRSSHLKPYIKVAEAGWEWKLAGFGVLANRSGRASR